MATSSLGKDLGASGRMMNRGKYFNKAREHPRQFFLGNQFLTSKTTSSLRCIKDPGLGEVPCRTFHFPLPESECNDVFYACALYYTVSSLGVGTTPALLIAHTPGTWYDPGT